jgi:glycosyltransferase involved in cell wall biosynthesis
MSESRALWIVPESSGGIRTYAEALLSAMGEKTRVIWSLPEPEKIGELPSEIVHIQHEFGLFGSKLPWRYRFPKWFERAKEENPNRKWVATAHTVLDEKWTYRTAGRGMKSIPLSFLNMFAPLLRKTWMEKTWKGFDGVVVHSSLQVDPIKKSGCLNVKVIPHFIPTIEPRTTSEPSEPTVLVFGYFSPEKGQDIVIRAWAELGKDAPKLILAGGVRRREDRAYHAMCLDAIRRFGLEERIEVTGYVPSGDVTKLFDTATLVLAPFRETSGSGSLATAIGHRAVILASDLPLNRELESRVPGSIAFFRSESSESLAEEVRALLGDQSRRGSLRAGAARYAETYSEEKISTLHHAFYNELLGRGSS